jgi:hypothetical protein
MVEAVFQPGLFGQVCAVQWRSELGALGAVVSGALVGYYPHSTSIPSSPSLYHCFMVSGFGLSTAVMLAFVLMPSDQRGRSCSLPALD